jgi:ATP-binding protein involved in chromosome partitioning
MFGKKSDDLSEAQIRQAAGAVQDPVLERSLADAGILQGVSTKGSEVKLELRWPSPAWEPKEAVQSEVEAALQSAGLTRKLVFDHGADVQRARPQGSAQSMIPGAKNILLFASGKGGVGKSTVATNVAAALAETGASVGLLDSDIYGPSLPTMLGATDRPEVVGQKLMPLTAHQMKVMSIGLIVDPNQAMSWRGPMLNGALTQFMRDVEWGELDYLILDLPPGTGDVQLTIAQNLKVSGAVLVSTPQDVALADVTRGKAMFDKVDIPCLGVVENMAYFVCGNCRAKHTIFSSGGAGRIAKQLGLPLLGEIPLEMTTRESGDLGTPEILRNPDSESAKAFRSLTRRLATELGRQAAQQSVKAGTGLKIIQ